MKTYTKAEVSEQELEDLVRRHADLIEPGLVFVDHQKSAAGGRLDVLLVDSGKSLVLAELKVVPDDGMLLQALDYYDYLARNLEAFAHLYKAHGIDRTQPVRLLLIAPSFSQTLVNRCTWISVPIALFTYQCLKFEDDSDPVPIFVEQQTAKRPAVIQISRIDDHLGYITDPQKRAEAKGLLDETKSWRPGSVSLDAIQDAISMKINGRVFAYFWPRRQHYWIGTYDSADAWTDYPVKQDGDLAKVKVIMQAAMERRAK